MSPYPQGWLPAGVIPEQKASNIMSRGDVLFARIRERRKLVDPNPSSYNHYWQALAWVSMNSPDYNV